ncbi:Uncharacterised protein [Klebsiella pneumoniae]|nr:Uncharacterised protein [Klebsiella pneumoniae]VDA38872.1 hypothetical protein BANRA_02937 [Klebsiella pneumoniae]
MIEIEMKNPTFFRHYNGCSLLEGMSYAKFIECICIVGRYVGNYNICKKQFPVHLPVNRTRMTNLIGSYALYTTLFCSWLNNFIISCV